MIIFVLICTVGINAVREVTWWLCMLTTSCSSHSWCEWSSVQGHSILKFARAVKSRVPCTKVLSQEIQIFQETSFCVLQVLLRNFTNTLWQLYIDFYTIRMVLKVLSNCVLLKLLI